MVSRSDVNELSRGLRIISDEAGDLLADFFRTVDLSKPEMVRDALLEVVPGVAREYGDLSATVAAEWFEDVRAREVGGQYMAQLGSTAAEADVAGSVRWAAGELFTDNPYGALDLLKGSLQRHVTYAGRDTVARNVDLDPKRPRWGRVPTGAKTCAFCGMLASRGFVYRSEQGALLAKHGNEYHDDCDCQAVMSWDAEQAHIEGYDPDALFEVYERARRAVSDPNDPKQLAAAMRRIEPDMFKDGVHSHV